MADFQRAVTDNVAGPVFVDTTCINCDTCRQFAPGVFADNGDYSYVAQQPDSDETKQQALRALLACPTGSIGVHQDPYMAQDIRQVRDDFPLNIERNVYICGFNSPKSFGGNSYFIHRPEQGNWLIDSPKFLPHLVSRLETMGGVDTIFLSHRDDVADAERFAQHFNARCIIHHAERSAQPNADTFLEGNEAVSIDPDITIIPTPGHTEGHCVLLYENRYLFTGDHLSSARHHDGLRASKAYNWYSWPQQIDSLEKLLAFDFQWVLPGHGRRKHLPTTEAMHQELRTLVAKARADEPVDPA